MPKSLLSFALLLFGLSAFSQTITLRGKILDNTSQLPLESATVYLTRVSDSTVVDYTITDKNGIFVMKTRKVSKPVQLKVSFVGYKTFIQELKSADEDTDFGTLRILEVENKLNEVVLKNEAPPIRIKNDTLEFNASSFKLRPDANVETLLKQLPGVEIDKDGKITVNGKEVNQILVNGKPFFDKDGKIALQNLPSDIINKVQVTDSKSKAEEISGQAASSNNASINLTIDEDKNKGFFGKFTGGYGTDDRFESSLLVNYFKGSRKISILGSANNINSTGFSMNEIFDNMGGGRNYSVWSGDDGAFGINGMTFGGGKGITRSNILGVNYADLWFKKLDVNSSYFYTGADTENTNRARQVTFLNDGNYTTESRAKTEDDKFAHNYNFVFDFKPDSTATISFNPKITKAHSAYKSVSSQTSVDEAGQLLNESKGDNRDESDKFEVRNSVYVYKSFKKKDRSLSATIETENNHEETDNLNRSSTTLYADENDDGIPEITHDDRNQLRNERNIGDKYYGQLTWQEPIVDSLSINFNLNYTHDTKINRKITNDFDVISQKYTVYNDALSNNLKSQKSTVNPGVGINISRKEYDIGITVGAAFTNLENRSFYLGNQTNLDKHYALPTANAYFNYKFTKSKSLYGYYNFDAEFPSANQILPVENLENPLNTFIGNPDLDPNMQHYAYLAFRDYDYATKSGYSFYGGGNYYQKQVVSSTVYDASRKRTTRYKNVSDTYQSWFGGNWSKSVKKEANSYKFGFGLSSGLNRAKGFVNGERYDARTLRMGPRANFTYDYDELLSITPSYEFAYNTTWYDNYIEDKRTNSVHEFKLQMTSYWPKHVVFGNDIGYTYNTDVADGFKKDFYLWNVSLGYNFFGDKLLAKAKVYDMLNQNQGTTRSVYATGTRDEENVVLKRYVMFSLTYKLEKFAGKKKEESHFFWDE